MVQKFFCNIQILNYLRETLRKCWKFGENFWGILDWLVRSILNIFMKSHTNFKTLLENYGINVKSILGKLWGNIRVILYCRYYGNYKEICFFLKFYWNCDENLKKRGEYSYKCFNVLIQILWHFLVNFWKTYKKLLGKYEKYFMVSVSFKNAVITLCIVTVLNISPLQIS